MTVQEYADNTGKNVDSVLKQLRRTNPGLSFGKMTELSDADLSALEKDGRKAAGQPRQDNEQPTATRTVTPTEKPATTRTRTVSAQSKGFAFASSETLAAFTFVGVFIAHAALVWFEIWRLYGAIGLIAGCVLVLISIGAAFACNAERLTQSSQYAVAVVAVLDIFAGFVHFEANKSASSSWQITIALSCIMAGGAFLSLILFRHIRQN